MISAFSTGFLLGLSLIVAIGAQNAFVLRQGLLRKYVFHIAFFCAISDALLISIGVSGMSIFLSEFVQKNSKIIFTLSAFWLIGYGILRLYSLIKKNTLIEIDNSKSNKLKSTISVVFLLTFANPHVYLDTMILIGSISQQYIGNDKTFFAVGACLASFIWFFTLAYGAKKLYPLMQKPISWIILDILIAIIMFTIAFKLISGTIV